MANIGNVNLFKTFKGKYQLTTADSSTKYAMLSCTNDVIFMNNFTSDSNKLLLTLPTELRPKFQQLRFPCMCYNGLSYVYINTNGNVTAEHANTVYNLEGFSFNISSKYYR